MLFAGKARLERLSQDHKVSVRKGDWLGSKSYRQVRAERTFVGVGVRERNRRFSFMKDGRLKFRLWTSARLLQDHPGGSEEAGLPAAPQVCSPQFAGEALRPETSCKRAESQDQNLG